ncbi:MAG: hypothetical protein WC341_16130 [Bacteroidales bacterium]|jgi:hypothetical protein
MTRKRIVNLMGSSLMLVCLFSCQDAWNEHYSRSKAVSEDFTIWEGDIESYIKEQPELTTMAAVLEAQGMFEKTTVTNGYTYIVYDNTAMANEMIGNEADFAKNSVSDVSISPSKLTDGFGIFTRLGKNIWVYVNDNVTHFDNFRLTKKVKTDNGYVYHVDGVIPVRPSVYDMLKELGDEYSLFVSLVERYEEGYFDKELSTPKDVDIMGNTTYDTVISVRNSLMDRYTADGLKLWDMRSEDFKSTMFIPSNDLIEKAINAALDSIPLWLGRAATEEDRTKFEKWIVRACFVDRRLSVSEVLPSAPDIRCVGGYQLVIDSTQDAVTYEEIDVAHWRPSIQTIDASNGVALSNGIAYYLTNFKIPNHVVIYRVKSKFYELWGAMTDVQKNTYFRWTNWIDPMIVNDAQTEFQLSETLPTMYYHVLTAIPSEEAIADSLVCSVTYDGLLYNGTTRKLTEVHLPAGEYFLRMGFKHSLRYSINIWFNDSLIVKNMLLNAQGSNFHFDRGSVSDLDYFGSSSIGFPEGYNWKDWIEHDVKAPAYDTDGYQVAIVTIPYSGNFTITIESEDDSYLYDPTDGRSKKNVTQLMMYHWCLRPTSNNY